jgi:hypothetical protein
MPLLWRRRRTGREGVPASDGGPSLRGPDRIRRFHIGGHDSQLVISTRSGSIGFLLAHPGGWAEAIRGQLPAAGPDSP